MEFKLTEEQDLIRKNMREFALKYVNPVAAEIDENERHPVEVFEKLSEGGWMGIPIPQEYGGSGSDFLTHIIAVEELCRVCASTGSTMFVQSGILGMLIKGSGSEAQKKKYLVPLARGQHLGAFTLTEPGAGTDVMAATTTAIRDGEYYILNGTKTFISNGPFADMYIVFCWTDKTAGVKGMTALIIPKGSSGLKPGEHFKKMGFRSSQTSEVVFKDCSVSIENLLGQEGDGLALAMIGLDHARVGAAAMAVGILQAALDESIRYSKERVQFGSPISKQQAIAWMIADMASDLSAARWLSYHAAWLKDHQKPFTKESAMAKLFGSERAVYHTIKAVQIQGGYGYIKGAKVERLMRDAKMTEIVDGTSEAQRMVISRSVLR